MGAGADRLPALGYADHLCRTAGDSIHWRRRRGASDGGFAGEFRRLSLAPEHVATDAYVIKVDGKAVPHGPLRNEALDLDLKGARQLELIAPAAKGEGASFIWHNLRFERQ